MNDYSTFWLLLTKKGALPEVLDFHSFLVMAQQERQVLHEPVNGSSTVFNNS